MKRKAPLFASALALLLAGTPVPVFAEGNVTAQTDGIWLNPHGTVAVRTGPCGDALCGHVVWASDKAKADARDSGITSLIGTELLEDYHLHGGVWQGTVYVPDMGRRFSSRLEPLSPTRLRIAGCILGGLFCKSQIWTRIAQVPA